MSLQPIKNTDLTQDDLDFLAELLNDFMDEYDAAHQSAIGIEDPALRYKTAEALYGRFIGADLSGYIPMHHEDCVCEWCELERQK
jgi:hypothetical protein